MSIHFARPLRPVPNAQGTVTRALSAVLRRTPLRLMIQGWRAKRRQSAELREWESRGRPVPPPHVLKQRVLKSYAARYRTRTLVETGTYFGDMVEAMTRSFDRIYSIELGADLHRRAEERFRSSRHIKILHGDSAIVLGRVITEITGPALFWLDGHYSGDITAKGSKDTPIIDELRVILTAPERGHVIVIDDARCFGGDPSYPSIPELERYIRSIRNDVSISVDDDSIRVVPLADREGAPGSSRR
jgi:hypothetical protein